MPRRQNILLALSPPSGDKKMNSSDERGMKWVGVNGKNNTNTSNV